MDQMGMSESEWREVVESLEDVGPYYDKVNSMMTFGLVDKWRRHVASYARPEDVVLEIGSGPGNFARHLASKTVYCIEPSSKMLSASRQMIDGEKVTLVRGVGEKIPLSDGSVDKVFCVFSFRDFRNKTAGVEEIHRVLKAGGEAFITDIAKPSPGPLAKMLEMHFKHLVPVLARVAVGPDAKEVWARDPYRKLLETYEAFGSPEVHEGMLRTHGFTEISTEYLELKGAAMTRGKKPWKSTSS